MFKIPDAVLKEGFQEVIDQDFNPDIVKCFGMDMWGDGCKFGLRMGVAATAGTMLGIYLGGKIADKLFKKPEEPDYDAMAKELVEGAFPKPNFDVKLK